MDKRWLAKYPPGIPAEVELDRYASLREMFESSCDRFARLPAFSGLGRTVSYRELESGSRAFAAFLQQSLGLKPGQRVAIMLPNLLQYPLALFAVLRAGLVVVNVNPQYTARELEHQLKDSGAVAIVVLENLVPMVQAVLAANPQLELHVIRTALVESLSWVRDDGAAPAPGPGAVTLADAMRLGHTMALDVPPLGHDDLAFLQYTGGTTGVSKGVMLSHGNMVANLLQVGAWIGRDLKDGEEVGLIPLPLYHVYALTCCLVYVKIGAHVVLVANPRDLPGFIATLKATPVTTMIGVNTLFRSLLDAPGFDALDWSHLKVASAGGMAVQRIVAARWKQSTGVPLVEGYGLTETSPVAVSNTLDIGEWTGHIGLPIPSTEVVILDDAGGELAPGEVGEIGIRGPQVTRGYWQRPEETAQVFTADGWLRTGDMGCMDEAGQFHITDRKKDMIIVSGFKVFPNEVEDVVALLPGVVEVAAVGVPDERAGESVRIIVVRSDPLLGEEALLAHCRQHLTGYKVPRSVRFSSEPLPKTSVGKILRRELRDAALREGRAVPG